MSGQTPKSVRRGGFTLLELLLVLALMGILTGVTIPIFRGTQQSHRFRTSVSTLSEAVRYARSTCITRAARGRLALKSDPLDLYLELEENPLEAAGTFVPTRLPYRMRDVLRRGVKKMVVREKTPSGLEETDGIRFYADGRCSDSFIYLLGPDEEVYTIAVVGITGQVMIFDHATESYYDTQPTEETKNSNLPEESGETERGVQ